MAELLLWRVWWQWQPERAGPLDVAYRWLNIVEGAAWLALAIAVVVRHSRRGGGWLNWPYATAFAVFGLSDFREAVALQSWLIGAKGVILLALLALRRAVISRYYPGSRTY
jgi:hypothetical protein